jgi:hypothetical protein
LTGEASSNCSFGALADASKPHDANLPFDMNGRSQTGLDATQSGVNKQLVKRCAPPSRGGAPFCDGASDIAAAEPLIAPNDSFAINSLTRVGGYSGSPCRAMQARDR